jgi:hypothetical protein
MREHAEALNSGRPPLLGEGEFGFMLGHDDLNGLPAGTTALLASRYPTIGSSALASPGLALLGTVFDEDALALLTGQTVASLERLTYRGEITALFGAANARMIGRTKAFRACPGCSARMFIARESILPLVDVCDEHGTLLVSHCTCGRPLTPFSPSQTPFHCPLPCGLPWAELRSLEPSPQLRSVQRRIIESYRWILREMPSDLIIAAARLASLNPSPRLSGGFEAPLHRPDDLGEPKYFASLAGIVGMLVARNLPPVRLAQTLPLPVRRDEPCRDQTCLAPAAFIRRNGARNGVWETYCAECGSRFLGDRILFSVNLGNGDSRLRVATVRRARRRLLGWQMDLHHAALAMMAERPSGEIRVKQVFARAEIPWAGYLLARRLRLVETVKATLLGELAVDADVETLAPLRRRWRSPFLPAAAARKPSPRGARG